MSSKKCIQEVPIDFDCALLKKYSLEWVEGAKQDFYLFLEGYPLDQIYHTGQKKQEYEALLNKWFGTEQKP